VKSYTIILSLILFLFAGFGGAQQHPNKDNGFSAEKAFHVGDIDSINAFNGNLVVTIPIGLRYGTGGGFSYGLTLVYNSNLWEADLAGPTGEDNQIVPGRLFNAGIGWTLTLGQVLPANHPANHTENWLYAASDGSQHEFFDRLHPSVSEPVVQGVSYSRDGSYLRLKIVGSEKKVEFPDGTIHTFDGAGRPTRFEDRFGNHLLITYPAGGNEWRLQDSQGRVHFVRFFSGQPTYGKIVKEVELAAFGTNPAAKYTFTYNNQWIETSCPNHTPPFQYQVPFLTNVAFPDGSNYSMALADYQPPNLGDTVTCDDLSGVLRRMTLPTKGKIEWDYGAYIFPTEGDRCRDFFASTIGVSRRRLISLDAQTPLHGEWKYVSDHPFPNCQQHITWQDMVNTVITPLGHKTETFFSVSLGISGGFRLEEYGLPVTHAQPGSGGRLLSKKIHRNINPDPASAPIYEHVRSEYLSYEWDSVTGATMSDDRKLNQRVAGSRTVYHDDAGSFADTAFSDFDGVGHHRTTTTNGSFAAGNVRTETTRFNPGRGTYPGSYVPVPSTEPWVLNTFTEKTAAEGSASEESEFVFESATGFLACTRTWRTPSARDSRDVLTIHGRDAAGNVTSESSYGGDVQTLGTGGVCTLNANPLIAATPPAGTTPSTPTYRLDHGYSFGALATTQYAGANFLSVDRQIDSKTGLVSRSCDTAGVCTNYTYDQLGRLTGDKHTTDSHTIYTYIAATAGNPARVDVQDKTNSESTVLTESKVVFDEFGRILDELKTMPDTTQSRKRTFYTAEGWKSSVSEVITAGPGATWNRYQGYDPFGRLGRLRPADMANGETLHDIDFNYNGVQTVTRTASLGTVAGAVTGEADASTTEIYDRQGRLYRVRESANPNGTETVTTYSYDAGGRLTQVSQTTAAGTQVRTFTYDGRGFLLGETHPEKDAVSGVEVQYSQYDARGHARRKLDGGVRLGYVFDEAERLLKVQEMDAGWQLVRDLKVFTYGAANSGSNKVKGKLQTATRHNYVDIGSPATPENRKGSIIETYTYAGQGGRVSEKLTEWWIDDLDTDDHFRQKFSYDHRGQMTQLEYPKCDNCGVPALAKTVNFTYNQGFLTAVPNYASAITYHANGLMATVSHTNGVKDRQDNDPRHLRRPALIRATTGPDASPTNLWSSGTFGYDGAGNILKMGSSTFVYDKVSRLVDSNLYTNELGTGNFKSQSYAFDGFGNMQSITTQIGSGTPTLRNTDTSPLSNRLTALFAAYDARGNLTSASGASYRYGPFNEAWRITNGSEDWVHIYNADDERLFSLKLGGTRLNRWVLRDLNGKALREYLQTGEPAVWSVASDYIYRDGLLLAVDTPSGQRHFHLDHLGTPRLNTNASGAQVAFHTYYPFGEEATVFNQDNERMKFTGHERDLGSPAGAGDDLDYMHARFFGPVTGRFMSVDPVISITRSLRKPQSWNRYVYAAGNPLKYVDPSGRIFILSACASGGSREECAKHTSLLKDALGKAGDNITVDKNGRVNITGVSAADFAKFGTFHKGLGKLISDEQNKFTLFVGTSKEATAGGGGQTIALKGGGANIYVDPEMFASGKRMTGDVVGTAVTTLVHETGHALSTIYPGLAARLGRELARSIFAIGEAYPVTFENRYRSENGLEVRAAYFGTVQDITVDYDTELVP
jgi:RHS repeat-associated protein